MIFDNVISDDIYSRVADDGDKRHNSGRSWFRHVDKDRPRYNSKAHLIPTICLLTRVRDIYQPSICQTEHIITLTWIQ